MLLAIGTSAMAGPSLVAGLANAPRMSPGDPGARPGWIVRADAQLSPAVEELVGLGEMGNVGGAAFVPGQAAGERYGTRVWLRGTGGIWGIDTTGRRPPVVIATPGFTPDHIVADPLRARLYVASRQPAPQLFTVDSLSGTLVAVRSLPDPPVSIAIAPDGSRAVINGDYQALAVVALPGGDVTRRVALDYFARSVAFDAARNVVYVLPVQENRILVYAADTLQLQRTLRVAGAPSELGIDAATGRLYVDSAGARLDVVDPATGATLATTTTPASSTTPSAGIVPGLDGKRIHRFVRGTCGGPNDPAPPACSALRVATLDSQTLAQLDVLTVDTRAATDSTWTTTTVVGNFLVAMPKVTQAVEYYHVQLGHYFVTALPAEIAALDAGAFIGWFRTGETIPVYLGAGDGPPGTSPVCRYFGKKEYGITSHFYSAFPSECAVLDTQFAYAWTKESGEVFYVYRPDAVTGACPYDTLPVYRLYNGKPDANHRYTTSAEVKSTMVGQGWTPEGYGPSAVGMCVPR